MTNKLPEPQNRGSAWSKRKEVKSRQRSRTVMCGIVYLILTVPWPIAYVAYVLSDAEAKAVVQSSAEPKDTITRQVPAATEDDSENKSGRDTGPISARKERQLSKDRQLLNKYAALIEYAKYFVPAYASLLLLGIGVLGFYFVNGRISDERAALIEILQGWQERSAKSISDNRGACQ